MTRGEFSRETRLAKLAELYDEIWDWAHTNYDRHLVKRNIGAVDPTSRLFIVGEAHAAKPTPPPSSSFSSSSPQP